MLIKEFIKIEIDNNRYYPVYSKNIQNVTYVAIFLHDGFPYIYRSGIKEFIKKNKEGMFFEMIELSIDDENNLVYISEPYENSTKEITPEINQLLKTESTIKLCRMNFLGHTVMKKDNFLNLLFSLENIVDAKSPFALLYLDENDWYDVLPFDTQEAMEQFVADHTKQETP